MQSVVYLSLNVSADGFLLWRFGELGHMEEELTLVPSKCLGYCPGMGKKSNFKCLCAIQEKASTLQWARSILSIT